jgi:membrane protease YdiL (CAAX protease family)
MNNSIEPTRKTAGDSTAMVTSLLALVVVGATVKAPMPFWPQGLGQPPALGLVVLIVGILTGVVAHSVFWWRDLDEAARQAHRRAWWRGGNLGILIGAAALAVALALNLPVAPGPMAGRQEGWAVFGFLCLLFGQAVGYGVAWVVERLRG